MNATANVKNWHGEVADRLGNVKAEMAVLKAEQKELEGILINSDEEVILGSLFRVTVSRFVRTRVDYRSICEKLKASAYMLATYSKSSDVTCIKVKAHKK